MRGLLPECEAGEGERGCVPVRLNSGRRGKAPSCPTQRWERAAASLWAFRFQVGQNTHTHTHTHTHTRKECPLEFVFNISRAASSLLFIYPVKRPIMLRINFLSGPEDLPTLFTAF